MIPIILGIDKSRIFPPRFNVFGIGKRVFFDIFAYLLVSTKGNSKVQQVMDKTVGEYQVILGKCRNLFQKKAEDYGTAWRILRLSSITDQIFIKANRIRSIQEKGVNKVGEGLTEEFIGIINYSIIALIQMGLINDKRTDLPQVELMMLYDKHSDATAKLLSNKNHDYGEAWRDMRVSSITDIILMKLLRIKQIEDNEGKTAVSEGIDANYSDIINYAVFALIKLYGDEVG